MAKTDNNGPKGTIPLLTIKMSRPGVNPIHFRIHPRRNLLENTRLPPGVRADDMPMTPVVTSPSDGYHDLSSDLGDGANARAIFDITEFADNPSMMNSDLWNDPERRQWVLDVARRARERDRRRERYRQIRGFIRHGPQPRIHQNISETEPNLSTSSEGEPAIFGRQGQIGINGLNLPPPPPVPEDPINYP